MPERAVATTKKPEAKQPCSNSCKQNVGFNSSGSTADMILQLQRTAGNRAVQKLIKSGALQAKLRIGQPNDIYEQEADMVAEQVMRMPDSVLQRKCAKCNKDERKVLRTNNFSGRMSLTQVQDVPAIVQDVLRSPGKPKDSITRTSMEARLGHNLSGVRVHTDDKSAKSANTVSALAHTARDHSTFEAGQYNPQSIYGQKLFAHELVHTLQQSASHNIVSASKQLAVHKTNDANERESEVTFHMIAQDHARQIPLKSQRISENTTIQRAIAFGRPRTEDSTSQEARAKINQAREVLNDPNLTPEKTQELQTRVTEAEAALGNYKTRIDSSSLHMHPMLATATTGDNTGLVAIAAGLVLLGAWIFGSNASRTSANRETAESLAKALSLLAEAVRQARPQPKAPPQEVPVPHPPGKVIPIETHPRFAPKAPQSGPQTERTPQPLGPDIIPPPQYEPIPEQQPKPNKPNNCFEQNPDFIPCEWYPRDINIVAKEFLNTQQDYNVDERNLGECSGDNSFGPNTIDACDGGPGETWHCKVKGAPEVSIFSCFCCEKGGNSNRIWRRAHWSPGTRTGKRKFRR